MTAPQYEQIRAWLQELGYRGNIPDDTSQALDLLRLEQQKHLPSIKQFNLLRSLGYDGKRPKTMAVAAVLIENLLGKQKSKVFDPATMEGKPVTDRQNALLERLEYEGPAPTDRAEASRFIDALLDGADTEYLNEYLAQKQLMESRPFDDPEVPGMKRFVFSIKDLEKIRRRIHQALPKIRFHRQPAGWSAFVGSWNKLFKVLKHLTIKDGYTLGAFLYRQTEFGNGYVFGVPTKNVTNELKFVEYKRNSIQVNLRPYVLGDWIVLSNPLKLPRLPKGGQPRYMSLFRGDGTPESFVEAAMLALELSEFGTQWRGVYWPAISLVGPDEIMELSQNKEVYIGDCFEPYQSELRFRYEPVSEVCKRANPSLTILPDKTIFRFIGYLQLDGGRIFLNRHIFSRSKSMDFEMISDDLAVEVDEYLY